MRLNKVNSKDTDRSKLSNIEQKVQAGVNSLNGGSSSVVKKSNELVGSSFERSSSVNESKLKVDNKDNRVLEGVKVTSDKVYGRFDTPKTLGKLSIGRVVAMVVVGVLFSALIVVGVYGAYYTFIRYPAMMVEDISTSGLGCIEAFVTSISTLDDDTIKGAIGDDSYLAKEVEYANGDENKIAFLKKMVGTVSYEPTKVVAKNIYGYDMVERGTDDLVYVDSLVNGDGESVILHYVDYSNIPLDTDAIAEIMGNHKLKIGDVDYSNKLVDVFVEYMLSLDSSSIPLVSIDHVPNMIKGVEGYSMLADEDIMLDKLLFSSKEFSDLLVRFSEVASGTEENLDWVEWNKLDSKKKNSTTEPEKFVYKLKTREEWDKWYVLSDSEKKGVEEPLKYSSNDVMSNDWCGSYYLINGFDKPISAEIGDGSKSNPAGLNTDVITYVLADSSDSGNSVRESYPIRIRLVDFKKSQDALDYFESKDYRNRGFDIKSEIQYVSYVFEVTNLSDTEIVVEDNSALSDGSENVSSRTGNIFGLSDSGVLKPNETCIIESWGSSTELESKYLIWGKNFKREVPSVWFRVLAASGSDGVETN